MSAIEPHDDKLQYIFDNARVGIAICNAVDNRLELVNPAFAHIHGYEPHELIGASPGEVFAPECMLRLSEHESTPSACSMGDVSFETTHIRKDGSLVPVSVHITVIKNHKGEVVQRIANIIDISERKEAETKLQTTNERFNQIFHNSPDVVYLIEVTPDGRFIHLDINPAFVEASGMPREQIVGRYVDEIENEPFRKILLDKYGACLKAGRKTNYINDYPLPAGIRTFHSVLTPMFDHSGRLYQIVGIARDITEQKRQEEQLAIKEREFRSLAENSPDPIFRYDRECRRLYVNPTVERLSGIPVYRLLGKAPSEEKIFPMQEALKLEATIRKVVRTGEPEIIDLLFIAPDGKKHYFQNNHIPEFGTDGAVVSVLAISHDITAIKQKEELLQSLSVAKETLILEERKFRSLAENIPDNIARWDTEGRYLYINPVHERTLGKTASEVIGTFIPDSHEAVKVAISQVAATGETVSVLQTVPSQEGSLAYHEVRLVPERDESGKIVSVMAIGRDITERKRQEEVLREREAFLDSLLKAIPIPVFYKNTDGIYLGVNKAYEKKFGTPQEQFIGKSVFDIHPKELAEIYHAKDTEIFEGKAEVQQYETQLRHTNGMLHDIIFSKAAFFDNQGDVKGLIGAILDITERKIQEERLHKTKAKLSAVISTIPDLIWVKDINGVYLMCNHAVEHFFGVSQDQFIGKTDYDFFDQNTADICKQSDLEAIAAGTVTLSYEPFVYPDTGADGIWEIRKIPVSMPNGESMGILGIARDITEQKHSEQQLQQALEFNEEIMCTIPDLLFELDRNGTYLNIWAQDESLLAAQKSTLLGKNIKEVLPHDAAKISLKTMRDVDRNGISLGNTIYLDLSEGRKYFELSASKRKSSGTYIVLSRDITERKAMEEKVSQNEIRLKEAQKIAKIGSWELDFSTLTLTWSDEIFRIFEVENTIQPTYELFVNAVHPDDRDMVNAAYENSLNNKTSYDIVHRLLMRDGRIKYIHERGETAYDEMGSPLRTIGTAQDITERKSTEKKIEHMAHHDALTGLPNRALAQARAEQIIAHAKRSNTKAAFLFVDLDGFKAINDTLGHSAGDAMLKTIAFRLKECIRESDIISRQGGDEFLLILSDINDNQFIDSTAKRVLNELEKTCEISGNALSVSGSIGIALYPDHGETFETLLQSSDTAMYKAKESGKNGYCFYTQQMNHNLIGQFKIQNDLKHALSEKQFVLFYQPQIDLRTNRIIGVEALIRWRHPHLGMIPPMNFIPVAESSGLIVQIGQWVIEEACRQAALWEQIGIDITVAVNISAMQFKRGNLEEIVKNALLSSKIEPKRLELELTESIIMHNADNTLQSVRNLKALGVQLSLDDFGTGYSSLAYLKRFAVDKLKIDQSFVRDILQDREDAAIVKTIIQMAKNLNLKTIAEGVEDAQVLAVIDEYGCDEVQGYHFAKPMEAHELEVYHANFYLSKS